MIVEGSVDTTGVESKGDSCTRHWQSRSRGVTPERVLQRAELTEENDGIKSGEEVKQACPRRSVKHIRPEEALTFCPHKRMAYSLL